MSRPEEHGAAEPDANGTEGTENEQAEAFSPLDADVEAPINAAVPFDDQQETEGG
jgi:hypothetical protein